MKIAARYSIGDDAPKDIELPFWADHYGTGSLAAETICRTVFANDNSIEIGSVVVLTILEPAHIAGTYKAELKRVLEVRATKKDAA